MIITDCRVRHFKPTGFYVYDVIIKKVIDILLNGICLEFALTYYLNYGPCVMNDMNDINGHMNLKTL